MKYWLMKSEPDVYPWSKLVADGIGHWDGVRNHTAKLNLMAMRKGDRAFFYHSNIGKEIVGVMEIVGEAHPDPTAEEGPWVQVSVKALAPADPPLGLADVKAMPELAQMALLKYSRLSVQPVTPTEWKIVCKRIGVKA
ncbi:MAG: EVE domain-containing protein [Azospirillum sp.]|nr:EVE domain-containing protein [Azospirillum sp.]MCA3267303.1 EVE domain-containing protein [Azospirillum sp.]MCZ8123623.1 EVE domain-containing protein [Magnetospirillum sp.]